MNPESEIQHPRSPKTRKRRDAETLRLGEWETWRSGDAELAARCSDNAARGDARPTHIPVRVDLMLGFCCPNPRLSEAIRGYRNLSEPPFFLSPIEFRIRDCTLVQF